MSNSAIHQSHWAHIDCIGMLPLKDPPFQELAQVSVSCNFIETEKDKQNEKTEKFVSVERTGENPEKTTNETEIDNLQDEELNALAIRMLTELGKRIDEHNKNINKEQENIKKGPVRTEEYNNQNEKHTRRNERQIGDPEEYFTILEDRIMENTQSEEQKENKLENKNSLRGH